MNTKKIFEVETTADTFEEIRENIRKETTRGAWSHGITEYALELLEDLEQFVNDGYVDITDLHSPYMCTKAVMNGAESWHDYSWGGCSLIYDNQIAERLCSPSELKKTDYGRKKPNAREEWLDVQQRALYQANQRLQTAIANTIVKGA